MTAIRVQQRDLAAAACGLVLLAGAALAVYGVRAQPRLDGKLVLSGLERSVWVRRDDSDVTHISAESPQDAWRALGFVHAQERGWQLEFNRRLMQGRLSETLGPATLEQLQGRLRGWDGRLVDQGRDEYRYIILLGQEPIGTAAVMNVSWRLGYAEIGYLIAEAYQRRGLGKEAVRQLLQVVFSQSTLRRLQALVSIENQASQRLLERLGFAREGVLREHFLVEGRPVDEVVFGLLRSEWAARTR